MDSHFITRFHILLTHLKVHKFGTGEVPIHFETTVVTPTYKSRDATNTGKNRPIGVIKNFAKKTN